MSPPINTLSCSLESHQTFFPFLLCHDLRHFLPLSRPLPLSPSSTSGASVTVAATSPLHFPLKTYSFLHLLAVTLSCPRRPPTSLLAYFLFSSSSSCGFSLFVVFVFHLSLLICSLHLYYYLLPSYFLLFLVVSLSSLSSPSISLCR